MEYLLLIAFLFGVTNKMADLMNEHGLHWFAGAPILFGAVWGGLGSLLVLHDGNLGAAYVALVLFWFLETKLDYRNHALAGVMMVISYFYTVQEFGFRGEEVIAMVAAYSLFAWIKRVTSQRRRAIGGFWRLRLRAYIVPLGYSLYIGDFTPFAMTVAGMLGVELVTNYYAIVKGVR